MKEQIESVLEAIRPVLMADGGTSNSWAWKGAP